MKVNLQQWWRHCSSQFFHLRIRFEPGLWKWISQSDVRNQNVPSVTLNFITFSKRNHCTRVVPKVMSNFFFFWHANWEQQTKESAVVDGTSCCVILECLVTSVACITWLVSLLTKWPTTICCSASVLSSNSLWKRKSLLQKFTRDFSVLMEVCAWVRAVFEDGWDILKMGKRGQFRKQCVSVFGWLERSSTTGEFSNFQNAGRNVYKEVAIMWKNKESYVD